MSVSFPTSVAEFSIRAGQLADAMAWVSHSITGSGITINDHAITLRVESGQFTLSASSRGSRHTVTAEAPRDAYAVIHVPAAVVQGFAESCSADALLHCQVDAEEWRLKVGGHVFAIPAFSGAEPAPAPEPRGIGTVPAAGLADLLRQTFACTGTDETLPTMLGIHIEPREDELFAQSTDRYSAAVSRLPWTRRSTAVETPEVVLPVAAMLAPVIPILRSHKRSVAEVTVDAYGHFGINCGGYTVAVRSLGGRLPDIESLAPPPDAPVAMLDRRAFAKAIKNGDRAKTFVHLWIGEGNAEVRIQPTESQPHRLEVYSSTFTGPWEVRLDGRQLNTLIKLTPGPTVTLRQLREGRPVAITGDGDSPRFLLQPIRT